MIEQIFNLQTGLLTFSSIGTATISAVIGMAGGIVLLSIMTFFLPLSVIVPIHGVVQLVSNSTRSILLRRHIDWKIFRWYLVGLPLGTIFSVYVLKEIENPVYFFSLIILVILYTVFKPKRLPALMIPYWGFFIIAFIVGFLGPLIGATGPFQAPFFLRDDLSKESIVATKAISQTFGHLMKIPAFLFLGFDYFSYTILIIFMALGTIVGTKYGVKILGQINQKVFTLLFKSALLFAAARVLYKMIY